MKWKKIISVGALLGCWACSGYAAEHTFNLPVLFSNNVYLSDAPTVDLRNRIPTGAVLRINGNVLSPAQDLTLWGKLLVETNQTITMVYKDAIAAASNGVIIDANGEITLTKFTSGIGYESKTLNPTNIRELPLGWYPRGQSVARDIAGVTNPIVGYGYDGGRYYFQFGGDANGGLRSYVSNFGVRCIYDAHFSAHVGVSNTLKAGHVEADAINGYTATNTPTTALRFLNSYTGGVMHLATSNGTDFIYVP